MSGLRSAILPPRRPLCPRARQSNKELRVPGHVPTPPRPQTGFARGRLSPRSRPHLFGVEKTAILRGFTDVPVSLCYGTKHETDAKKWGKSGEFVLSMF